MKRIDSDALGILTKSLGLTGAGSPITELADGVVDQMLSIAPIVRRSRTQAQTQGIYTGVFSNVHVASDERVSTFLPYTPAAGVSIAPYPSPVPAQFDIWLLGATVRRTAGSGTVTAALFVLYEGVQQGFGVDSAGAAVVAASQMPVAFWDTFRGTGSVTIAVTSGGLNIPPIGLRLPRQPATQLLFRSSSSAALTLSCDVILGVFPVALGQDGLV